MALHRTSLSSLLIFSSHLCLNLSTGLFPSGFLTKTLYPPLLSPLHASCHTHLILLELSTQTFGDEYRSYSSSICSPFHPHPPLLPRHTYSQISSSAPYSPTPSAMFLSERAQVSHPHKMGKIIFLCILIFIFLDSKLKDKKFCTE